MIDSDEKHMVTFSLDDSRKNRKSGSNQINNAVEVNLGIYIDSKLLAEFPEELARKYSVVPLQRLGKGMLVGSLIPTESHRLRELSKLLEAPVAAIPCHIDDFESIFEAIYTSTKPQSPKLGEILRKDNVITAKELEDALTRQQSEPRHLGRILVDLGLISEEELNASLTGQERTHNPHITQILKIDPALMQLLPEHQARKYGVLPLTIAGGELVLATFRHLSEEDVSELSSITRLKVRAIPTDKEELIEALTRVYRGHRRSKMKSLRLGEILKTEGLIDEPQLKECLAAQKKSHKKLGEIIVERGYVSEEAVFKAIATKLNCEFLRFATSDIDLNLSHYISSRFAERNQILLISCDEEKHEITVAMADPGDLNLRDIIQGLLGPHGYTIRPVLSTPTNIQIGIAFTYQSRGLIDMQSEIEMETVTTEAPEPESEDLLPTDEIPEVKRMVNQMLYNAVTGGVSDIHLENHEHEAKVRFRIDGILEDRLTPINKNNLPNVISILKVDAGLDIAERRRSQDGVFKKRIGKDYFIDFRINVHATPFGQDAVIRILDRRRNLMPLDKLGFDRQTLSHYHRLIQNPQGLILFTGPTGSGKTTTLYSTLMYLNQGNKKIVTAEDPIEYTLDGISQYQVNEAIGNTFDDYARRFLRKDPDIILIGEIRDRATSKSCVDAAMTGHLVFSTLHTNDCIGVVPRLRNLGTPESSIADSILLVVSQRLARRICVQCREEYTPEPETLEAYFPQGVPERMVFNRGVGCEACRYQGYRGRVGIYEFWEVHPETRREIYRGVTEEELRDHAIAHGMRPLLEDALLKVKAGITTLEELARVVSIEQVRQYASFVRL